MLKMSKELEALRVLKANAILFDDGTDFGASMLEAICDIDKALTPPTADQLCEELSKYMKEPVWLDERNEIRISTQWLVRKIYYEGEYKGLNFLVVLPPRIIKRIAQFYESEAK